MRINLKNRWVPRGLALALGIGLAGGCSGGGSGPTGSGPEGPDDDRPENGVIRIDESELLGVVDRGRLEIDLPIEALSRASSGTLNVSLIAVDGSRVLETQDVTYEVDAREVEHVLATFEVPEGISEQANWVTSNVRVDDGSSDGLRITSSLLRVVSPYELLFDGAATLKTNKTASYRVRAQNPYTRKAVPGLGVTLDVKEDEDVVLSEEAETDEGGDAFFTLELQRPGDFKVEVSTESQGTRASLSNGISVTEPGQKLLLTTDKPVYQPGQFVHLRALALVPPQNMPVVEAPVVFEIEDGKGNKIFKREVLTDEHGIAASQFQFGRVLNMGTFKVRAVTPNATTEKTVNVSRYALPKFRVGLTADRDWYGPSDTLEGTLDAGYFFGKPVAGGDVVIEGVALDVGETVFQRVVGKTDAQGKLSFSLTLPSTLVGLPLEQGNALLSVRASVTDTAGQEVKKELAVTVAESPLRLVLVPEGTDLVPGLENRLQLFVTDPLGAPVEGAEAEIQAASDELSSTTDAFGYAELEWTPPGTGTQALTLTVTPDSGSAVTKQFSFEEQAGSEHVIVRTDKAVYAVGETVRVEVAVSDPEAAVYVDWLNDGQVVEQRTLTAEDGVAGFSLPVDSTLLGTNRVEAYVVDGDGNVVRAGRTIFARTDAALDVTLSTDQDQYAPGAPARLTFSVVDEEGNPAVAALGVQVVDEAVFSLIDARPGLLNTYFQLEDAYSEPRYEIQPPPASIPELLFQSTRASNAREAQAAQRKTEGVLSALGSSGSFTGLHSASWKAVIDAARRELSPFYDDERERLSRALRPVVENEISTLEREGCSPNSYYCSALEADFPSLLVERLKDAIVVSDFWGNRYRNESSAYSGNIRLCNRGPDEVPANDDDDCLDIAFASLGLDRNEGGLNPGVGGSGNAVPGAPVVDDPSAGPEPGEGAAGAGPGDDGSEGPRVRSDFPETLYVNPALITGPDGTATIDVDMADSITEWRVSTLAHSTMGKLGGGQSGIRVFQDFFADVSFPATLTRGDEVEFPIAVYNYLQEEQTIELSLAPGSWYTPLGLTTQSVVLAPGEVIGARFPVRVEEVGSQTLTVTAQGSAVADAVARRVLVVPDGKEFPNAISGSLAAGSVEHAVAFPVDAIPGSPELLVEIYPAFLSQVVTGMDSMLQVPSGCFEQTTSTTWPNVLVTRYMTQTGQITPEIQLKAESLISAGYQRLLTFEHDGGGFSWFGEQDPAPFLSVTAFGVMEFADMAKVHAVDPAMIERTIAWLLAQQQPDGSWEGDVSEFFSFQTSVLRNTAFVVWALGENGVTGSNIESAVAFIKSKLGSDDDPYTLGIVANALSKAAPGDPATAEVFATLEQKKQVDGDKIFWDSEGTQTNFYGGGNDAAVSATALVAHAMLTAGGHKATVDGALTYLLASKDSFGNFGSTQATIWTLRTLLLAAEKGTDGAVGSLEVSVDGAPFATIELSEAQSDVMTTVDLKPLATIGPHQVALSFIGTGKVSYNVIAKHHVPWDLLPEEPLGPLSVAVSYDKTTLAVNDTVRATVEVQNNTAAPQNMIIATIGIPPGFSVQSEDLDAYKASGELSTYEITGKQLTLYLTELPASATRAFEYGLLASMPVKAVDGGASAYLYYEPEKKAAQQSQRLEVR